MSAIQDLAPFIGAYQGKIRRAKDASGMTLEELSNESGVSFSAVSRLYAGTQADPRLYNSAALCKTLGLSLDELFGLENRVGSPEKLTKQIHHVERTMVENLREVCDSDTKKTNVREKLKAAVLSLTDEQAAYVLRRLQCCLQEKKSND